VNKPDEPSIIQEQLRRNIENIRFYQSMGNDIGEKLKIALREYTEHMDAVIARIIFEVELRTACGASRTINWRGRPPKIFSVALYPTNIPHDCISLEAGLTMQPKTLRERKFELIELDIKAETAIYREVVE
jgi:hypothetical protein